MVLFIFVILCVIDLWTHIRLCIPFVPLKWVWQRFSLVFTLVVPTLFIFPTHSPFLVKLEHIVDLHVSLWIRYLKPFGWKLQRYSCACRSFLFALINTNTYPQVRVAQWHALLVLLFAAPVGSARYPSQILLQSTARSSCVLHDGELATKPSRRWQPPRVTSTTILQLEHQVPLDAISRCNRTRITHS
jgi:hypothetical protein